MNKISEVINFYIKQYKKQSEAIKTTRKLKKYYTDVKKDTRTTVAKIIDYVGLRMGVFFSCLGILLIVAKNLYISLFLALFFTSVFHAISITIRNKRSAKLVHDRRKYLASQRVYKQIKNMSIEEFSFYAHEILENSGFHILRQEQLDDKNMIIDSIYKKAKLKLILKKHNGDTSIQLKEIKNIIEMFKGERVVFIAINDFTKECIDYAIQNQRINNITLIDKDKLLKLIDKANMFPTDVEMDEYVMDKIEKKTRKLKEYKEIMLTKTKAKSYIALSSFLLIWAKYTMFYFYYNMAAVILMGLAIITIYSNIKKKRTKEQEFSFDELLGEQS